MGPLISCNALNVLRLFDALLRESNKKTVQIIKSTRDPSMDMFLLFTWSRKSPIVLILDSQSIVCHFGPFRHSSIQQYVLSLWLFVYCTFFMVYRFVIVVFWFHFHLVSTDQCYFGLLNTIDCTRFCGLLWDGNSHLDHLTQKGKSKSPGATKYFWFRKWQ